MKESTLKIASGATLLAGALAPLASQAAEPQAAEKLNVLILMCDDMNGFGSNDIYPEVVTPNIHNLREQSINFTASSCSSPVSGPSRTSFYSGLYPHTTGVYYNGADGWNNNSDLHNPAVTETLPECFNTSGYDTWGRGKLYHAPFDKDRMEENFNNRPIYTGGFGPFFKGEYQGKTRFMAIKPWDNDKDQEHPDVLNSDAAIEYFAESHDKPFMMCLGLWKPHCPYTSPKRFFDLYKDKDLPLPLGYKEDDLNDIPEMGRDLVDSLKNFGYKGTPETEGTWRQFIEAYCANYSFADWNVGRVLEALDKSEYADNTIVIFCGDNGYNAGVKLRWEKSTLWETAAYVPMMVRLPKSMRNNKNYSAKGGLECNIPVGLIDIYPTLVELCGLDAPIQKLDGESIVPMLENPSMKSDRTSITTYGILYSSIRDSRYRLITYPDGSRELYDLKRDPHEWTNIADKKSSQKVVERLSKEIPTRWAKDLGGRNDVSKENKKANEERYKSVVF